MSDHESNPELVHEMEEPSMRSDIEEELNQTVHIMATQEQDSEESSSEESENEEAIETQLNQTLEIVPTQGIENLNEVPGESADVYEQEEESSSEDELDPAVSERVEREISDLGAGLNIIHDAGAEADTEEETEAAPASPNMDALETQASPLSDFLSDTENPVPQSEGPMPHTALLVTEDDTPSINVPSESIPDQDAQPTEGVALMGDDELPKEHSDHEVPAVSLDDLSNNRPIPENSSDEDTPVAKRARIIEDSSDDEGPNSPMGVSRLSPDNEQTGVTENTPVDDHKDLINDIFGSSDSEEDFQGFDEDDVMEKDRLVQGTIDLAVKKNKEREERNMEPEERLSDFELMLKRRKEEQGRHRRRRKDVDIINDQDDKIIIMIQQMREAADADRALNKAKQVATKKLKILKTVMFELRKCHLQSAFIENGILLSIAEWLSPLPDKNLPHIEIRKNLLQVLESFPMLDTAMLKESGLGKAIMILYKHPKETRENKIIAGKLINAWARPIFGLTSDFGAMTKEEREERDYEKMPKSKRSTSDARNNEDDDEDAPRGPGDPGFIARARVPMPSNRDYVLRPKINVEQLEEEARRVKGSKKDTGRLDKYINKEREKKARSKNTHAVKISISG